VTHQQQAVEAVEDSEMIELKVRKIERYEVTRYSENIERAEHSCEPVASNLTASQADDIAGAMFERANSMGMVATVIFSDGAGLTSQQETPSL